MDAVVFILVTLKCLKVSEGFIEHVPEQKIQF